MHITDHLQPCCVALRQQADSLPAAIHQLVELVQKSGCLTDTVQFEQDVLEREKMGGICMGRGLAIPHAKSAGVAHAELAALTLDPPLPCTKSSALWNTATTPRASAPATPATKSWS